MFLWSSTVHFYALLAYLLLDVINSGYMSPEYAMRGAFSVKSDTYSFGVLLLEIVSGLKISSPQLIKKFGGLISYVSIVEYYISN